MGTYIMGGLCGKRTEKGKKPNPKHKNGGKFSKWAFVVLALLYFGMFVYTCYDAATDAYWNPITWSPLPNASSTENVAPTVVAHMSVHGTVGTMLLLNALYYVYMWSSFSNKFGYVEYQRGVTLHYLPSRWYMEMFSFPLAAVTTASLVGVKDVFGIFTCSFLCVIPPMALDEHERKTAVDFKFFRMEEIELNAWTAYILYKLNGVKNDVKDDVLYTSLDEKKKKKVGDLVTAYSIKDHGPHRDKAIARALKDYVKKYFVKEDFSEMKRLPKYHRRRSKLRDLFGRQLRETEGAWYCCKIYNFLLHLNLVRAWFFGMVVWGLVLSYMAGAVAGAGQERTQTVANPAAGVTAWVINMMIVSIYTSIPPYSNRIYQIFDWSMRVVTFGWHMNTFWFVVYGQRT